LEQAGFVDELKRQHALGVAEIATALSRSKAWVSLRLGLVAELPPLVLSRLRALVNDSSGSQATHASRAQDFRREGRKAHAHERGVVKKLFAGRGLRG
jgi:hypothetical protein